MTTVHSQGSQVYNSHLEALRKFRSYILNNNRGEATLALRSAVDDYAGFLTGNRQALWAQDARSIQPKWD